MKYTRRNILQTITAMTGAAMLPLESEAKRVPVKHLRNETFLPDSDPGDLDELINLFDFEKKAEGVMPKMAYEYVASGVPATIEVLPYIARIRRGTDVVKAIALGANAVLVGRPICYGLACGGAEGVAKV